MTILALGTVTPNTEACAEAIAALFPAVPLIGGYRPGTWGYHRTGQALDVMVYSDQALGDRVAAWAIANHAVYGVTEVIWRQRFFNPLMPQKGWRMMTDRGGITANHFDHVHLSTFGIGGGVPGPPPGPMAEILDGSFAPAPVQTITGEGEGSNVRFRGSSSRIGV